MKVVGDIVCYELGKGMTGCSWECFSVSGMVFVSMSWLLYVVCFLRLGVVCCVAM